MSQYIIVFLITFLFLALIYVTVIVLKHIKNIYSILYVITNILIQHFQHSEICQQLSDRLEKSSKNFLN